MSFSIAIVGRPNVGKSTLFNRLIGKRKAIVYNRPGVTRDRNEAEMSVGKHVVKLVDTGGFEFDQKGSIEKEIKHQIEEAISEADVLLWVVDVKTGIHTLDHACIELLRKANKPIVLICNKVDPGQKQSNVHEFLKFGLKAHVLVSAEHGLGIEDLKEAIEDLLEGRTPMAKPQAELSSPIHVALVGRPNVGKSSIINTLLGEHRLAVSEIAGTTRDMVDISFTHDDQDYVFLDTAGMRYKRKVQDDVEYFSIKRTFEAIEKADVVLLILSGPDQLTTQEEKIAAQIIKHHKPLSIFVNKWDLCEKGDHIKSEFRLDLYAEARFLSFADVFFVSALHNKGLEKLLIQAKHLFEKCYREYKEDDLIDAYKAISNHHHQVGRHGYFLELKRLTAHHRSKQSPVFRIKCNNPKWVTTSYRKYWKNALTDFFRLRGIPIDVKFRQK